MHLSGRCELLLGLGPAILEPLGYAPNLSKVEINEEARGRRKDLSQIVQKGMNCVFGSPSLGTQASPPTTNCVLLILPGESYGGCSDCRLDPIAHNTSFSYVTNFMCRDSKEAEVSWWDRFGGAIRRCRASVLHLS